MKFVFEQPDRPVNQIDRHVGARLRLRRRMLGVSQARLADVLESDVDAVQKYELGHCRISAGTLYVICQTLDVPMSWFFVGFTEQSDALQEQEHDLNSIRSELDLLLERAPVSVQVQIVSLARILVDQQETRQVPLRELSPKVGDVS